MAGATVRRRRRRRWRFSCETASRQIHAKEEKRESADKPGSVVDSHSSGTSVTECLVQPTRTPRGRASGPYSVLLQAGFAVPPPLPATRCALTAPFHPYRAYARRYIFCGTFRRLAPPGDYPAPLPSGARTFLPAGREGRRSDCLADSRARLCRKPGGECKRAFGLSRQTNYTDALNARSMSSMMSATFSMPMDRRTRSVVTPEAANSSSDS